MLELKNIKKDYHIGSGKTTVLKNINIGFRKNEFVSIFGPSGCGKTTLLNLIGGLDKYDEGDLLLNGKSTKMYKDNEWDAYRNNTIGFVFQNYNLISHLSVLSNVEIALSLSGVSKKERIERAKKVLIDVGLEDHLTKRPNQLSGGQMQRVAIARALVNNPKILLADEPTGALDSVTSTQIMELIKKISQDRLVILVTHNKKIANTYSDRIIELLDGKLISDSKPYSLKSNSNEVLTNKKTSMSYLTALKSSFNNLLTKKGRTFIIAIAGSIGIIGIALVLAISNGMTAYVDSMEGDTLSGFPLEISQTVYAETNVFDKPAENLENAGVNDSNISDFTTNDVLYPYDELDSTVSHYNIFSDDFISYMDDLNPEYYNSISYTNSLAMNVITNNQTGGYNKVETEAAESVMPFMQSNDVFFEMPSNQDFILSQYDLLGTESRFPLAANELVLVVDSENQIDIDILNAFGISIEDEYSFADFIGMEFRIIPNNTYYTENEGIYTPSNDYQSLYNDSSSIPITIVGIMRINPDSTGEIMDYGIGYTNELTNLMLNSAIDSDIVQAQIDSPNVNVLNNEPFNTQITYEEVMQEIGGNNTPTGIQIYPESFDSKELIKDYIDLYNINKEVDEKILYTDLAETISGMMTSMIDIITIVLAAFAGISLVVSSIMIGIITYVSVVERTKEIGIMRSVGARKKDISRIFNAEAIIIGFTAGAIGVLLSVILSIPINIFISQSMGISGFANLPISNAIGLLLLSILLTFIAGLIPSKIASNREPVKALRVE